jgi:hypothetical protein
MAVNQVSYSETVRSFYEQDLSNRLWRAGTFPCQEFPQIKMKPNFGIAISGGGLRAAAVGLGWLRALNKYGLLTKARYISVNSGGSWVAEPLLWNAVIEGRPTASMSVADIDTVYQTAVENAITTRMPKALSENFGGEVISSTLTNLLPGMHANVWSDAVDKIFVAVNGLHESDYLSVHGQTPASSRLPFLIVNGSVVMTDHRNEVHIAPFEFTPTYCGMPVDPKILNDCFNNHGGFIHRTVFAVDYNRFHNDKMVKTDSDGSQRVSTTERGPGQPPFKLSQISSVSSSAVVQGYYERAVDMVPHGVGERFLNDNFPVEEQYWALNEPGNEVEGSKVKFADGGAADNSGIIALLRRGVTDVIAGCAILVDIAETDEQVILDSLFDYMGLFGRVTEQVNPINNSANYNRVRQVFNPEHWDQLLTAMREKRTRGDALVHTFSGDTALEVQPNICCGVVGGYRVNITFAFNGRSTNYPGVDWNSLEPSRWSSVTQYLDPLSAMAPHHIGSDFPIIPTEVMYYSEELVSELAALAAWSLDEGSGTLLADLTDSLGCSTRQANSVPTGTA